MAEAFGIAASIIQIADLGARLSLKLFTFGRQVKGAEQNLESAAKDALTTARDVAKECEKVFGDLEVILDDKGLAAVAQEGSFRDKFRKMASKVKYPFIEPHIEFLRSNLDRLKSTLVLMLQVIIYAGQLRSNTGITALQEQRNVILQLKEEKEANDKKYHELVDDVEGMQIMEPQVSSGQHLPAKEPSETFIHPLPPIYTRLNKLDNVPQPANLQHYKTLVNRLIKEVDGVQYRIDEGRLSRMRDYILFAHRCEIDGLKATYGEKKVVTLFSKMPSSLDATELAKNKEYVEKRSAPKPSPAPPPRPVKALRRSIFSPIEDPGNALSRSLMTHGARILPRPPFKPNVVRPRLSVHISSNDSDSGSSTAESSPRGPATNETATPRVDSKNDSTNPVRPSTSHSAVKLPNAGSQTTPNPFAKLPLGSVSERNSNATINGKEEEAATTSPLPFPFPDAGLLPSPTSSYPNWGLNHSTNQEISSLPPTTSSTSDANMAGKANTTSRGGVAARNAQDRNTACLLSSRPCQSGESSSSSSEDPDLIGELPEGTKQSRIGSPRNEIAEKKKQKTSRHPDGSKEWQSTKGTIIPGTSRLPQSHSDVVLLPPSPAPPNPPPVSATYIPGVESLGPGQSTTSLHADSFQYGSYSDPAELSNAKTCGVKRPNTSGPPGNPQPWLSLDTSLGFDDGFYGEMPQIERTLGEKPEKDEATIVAIQLLLKWTSLAPTASD